MATLPLPVAILDDLISGSANEVIQDGGRKRKGRHFPPPPQWGSKKVPYTTLVVITHELTYGVRVLSARGKIIVKQVYSQHKGQWLQALMFSLICVWINDWVTNREADDLRRYRAHYDVIVMN